MTKTERETIEQIKRERAAIANPLERIAFDNGADGRPFVLHLIAALESSDRASPDTGSGSGK